MSEIYQIRRKIDGLFSTGGSYPSFRKSGKKWLTRSALSNHLAILDDGLKSRCYKDCEIVRIEILETEVSTIDVSNWTLAKSTLKAKEKEKERREIREAERQKARTQREIEELEKRLNVLKNS